MVELVAFQIGLWMMMVAVVVELVAFQIHQRGEMGAYQTRPYQTLDQSQTVVVVAAVVVLVMPMIMMVLPVAASQIHLDHSNQNRMNWMFRKMNWAV